MCVVPTEKYSLLKSAIKEIDPELLEVENEKMMPEEQINREEAVDELLQEGLIQRFEYTHELAWKVMKDYAEYQGVMEIFGSRDAIRHALRFGIIDDEKWMQTISDRNITSHQYDDDTAKRIVDNIINVYYPLFVEYEKSMLEKISV